MVKETDIFKRFYLFYNLTGLSRKAFSDQIGIHNQNFIRLCKKDTSILKKADVLMKLGCNTNWLISGQGPIIYHNENGFRLIRENELLTSDGYLKSSVAINRMRDWIENHFYSLAIFCKEHNLDYEKYNSFLYNDDSSFFTELPDNTLIRKMDEAGCNISWIFSSSDDVYAWNENGKRLRKESKYPANKMKIHELKNGKDAI